MYCTIQDMIDRYGEKEMTCIADRSLMRTAILMDGGPNELRVNNAIIDACSEIDSLLTCCLDIKQLKSMITATAYFPLLRHLNADIARYYLYDDIQTGKKDGFESKMVEKRYEDALRRLKKICECGGSICTNEGDCISEADTCTEPADVQMFNECWPVKTCCTNNICKCDF